MATPAGKIPSPQRTQITEQVTSGDLPGIPSRGIAPNPGKTKTVKASLTSQYVTAGQWQFYLNYLRSLPYAIDDVTRDFGDDLYERIMHDAQVFKLVSDFKAGMLEDGLDIQPADTDDPADEEEASNLADWCMWALEQIDTPLEDLWWDLAEAVPLGSRVAEIVWHVVPDPDGKPALLPRSITCKPRTSTAFVTNSFNELVGLLGLIPGQPFLPQTGLIITDPSFLPNFLPREKFMVYTFRPKNGDPRGTSLLRPLYDAWWSKQQVKVSYLKFLAQFASPSLVGMTPPGAEAEPVINEETGEITIGDVPETVMADRLANFANGTVATFPAGSEVHVISGNAAGSDNAFGHAFKYYDDQMAGAALGQTLASEEGKHQTRAASGTHENLKDMLIRQAKGGMVRSIRRDLIKPMVRYNKGDDALRLLPRCSLGSVEQRDFNPMALAIAALMTAGYIGQSQLPGIDDMLGLPARDPAVDGAMSDPQSQMPQADPATGLPLHPHEVPGVVLPPGQETPPKPAPAKRATAPTPPVAKAPVPRTLPKRTAPPTRTRGAA